MSEKDIKDIILQYIIKEFANNENITYDTQLIHEGYIHSFSIVLVLLFLEKTFNIKIDNIDTQSSNFNTINDMYNIIIKYIK